MKRIVICCDGTWNARDRGSFTHVARMAQAVTPVSLDGTDQVVYYDAGVGNDWGRIARISAGAFGRGLSQNVQEAYSFLVDNYGEGDEIWLFGFSRGAFTVRSLAGFIRKCGILDKDHSRLIKEAYKIYRYRDTDSNPDRRGGADSVAATEFREKYAQKNANGEAMVAIRFIGVWDTVGALGVPLIGPRTRIARWRWGFHDARLSRSVEAAYHALSIDERRGPFAPTLWEIQAESREVLKQRVEQVWFPGFHSDVGGTGADSGIPAITFLWMASKAVAEGLGLDEERLAVLQPDAFGPINDSWKWYYFALPHLLGRTVRQVGRWPDKPLSMQKVDQSALLRFNREDFDYWPANIKEYLEKVAPRDDV